MRERLIAIFLGGDHAFHFFTPDEDTPYAGLLIPEVSIDVDETSLFDATDETAPVGAVVRANTHLTIAAMGNARYSVRAERVPLIEGLAPCEQNVRAGFHRWQIVLGSGIEKRILKTIDVTPQASR